MDYDINVFTKDKHTAEFIFNKYYKSYTDIKDDLIQEAITKLWAFRNKGKTFTTKTAGANKIAFDAMADYMRKINRHLDNVSLDSDIDDELALIETMPAEQDTADLQQVRYVRLLRHIKNQLAFLGGRQQEIIKMYLNRRSFTEIGKCVGVSKQYVSECVIAFREAIAGCYRG